jgi:hypothetical protein
MTFAVRDLVCHVLSDAGAGLPDLAMCTAITTPPPKPPPRPKPPKPGSPSPKHRGFAGEDTGWEALAELHEQLRLALRA